MRLSFFLERNTQRTLKWATPLYFNVIKQQAAGRDGHARAADERDEGRGAGGHDGAQDDRVAPGEQARLRDRQQDTLLACRIVT